MEPIKNDNDDDMRNQSDKLLSFDDFWYELSEWSQATFGSDQQRGPQGPLEHLAKEVQEALVAPTDIEEYADLVFLTFDAARRAGFSVYQLRKAITAKLAKNKARKWSPPSTDKPVEHIRSS